VSQGLGQLKWSPELYWIARIHSQDMGTKKVPFGHDGFQVRAGLIPWPKGYCSENVAWCSNYPRDVIGETVVNGWINSEGHKRNLLSGSTECAVAAIKGDDGYWYFTQIFAKRL
jgi:uncharacterized protein YkwD